MTTLTSTGAVNLTASTNWSPAQVPVAGDDLVVAGHTLTLDANMTLNSITFNSSSSRIAFSGTSRSVQATNGFTLSGAVNTVLISTTIDSGATLSLTGQWIVSGTPGAAFTLMQLNGGTLNLSTVGASQSAALTSGTGIRLQQTGGGSLNTTGRITQSNAGPTSAPMVTLTSGGWTHRSSGANNLLNSSHGLCSISGTAFFDWQGDFTSATLPALTGLVTYSGSGNLTWVGDVLVTNAAVAAGALSALFYCVSAYSGTTSFTGSFRATVRCWIFYSTVAHTINWLSQSVSIASGEAFAIYATAGSFVFTNLVVTNAGKFNVALAGSATLTANSGTSVTCTSTAATACAFGTTSLDGKIVVLESSPATLPGVSLVASGTSYGYSGSLLTGTGIINDPAAIAAAMLTSFGSLPEVLIKTTIATLASQTSFTLTAGSADNNAYVGKSIIVTSSGSSVRKAVGSISAYVGSTRAVTLSADPAIYTMAVGDTVYVIAGASGGSSFPSEAPADWLRAAGIQDGALTAAKFAASSLNGKGDWLLSSGYTAPANSTIASIYTLVQFIDSAVATMPVDVRNAILNRVLAGNHVTSGSVGLLLQFLDALISSRLAPATAGRTLAVSAAGAVELDSASRLAIWNTLTTETFTADSFGELLLISDGTNGREVKVTGANHIAADVHEVQPDGLSGSTEITNIENASGYLLAVLAGACADPQTASETYAITVFGSTFTVDMAGQTSTGTRTAPTLTKT